MFSLKFVLRVNMQAGCRETCTLSVGRADGGVPGRGGQMGCLAFVPFRFASDLVFWTFRPLKVETKELSLHLIDEKDQG